MKTLKTFGRNRGNQDTYLGDALMSGILIVGINEKKFLPKFVEVKYNSETQRSCMLVYKNRDKTRLEIAMVLNDSKVIIEEKSLTDIVFVYREGRIVALKVSNDREDMERCVAQWRNVFRVTENPEYSYSVIIITGESRGSVVMVTLHEFKQDITFKYLCGPLKDKEITCEAIVHVEKLSDLELMVDLDHDNSLHFISKRPKSLYEKLSSRVDKNFQKKPSSIPLAQKPNYTCFYDSKLGYTPTFGGREVQPIPESDYLVRDPHVQPIPESDYLVYDPQVQPIPESDYMVHDPQVQPIPESDYLDHNPQVRPIPESDYLVYNPERIQDQNPVQAGYCSVDRDPLMADYLAMEEMREIRQSFISPCYSDDDEKENDGYIDPNLTSVDAPPPPPPPRAPIIPSRKLSAPPSLSPVVKSTVNNEPGRSMNVSSQLPNIQEFNNGTGPGGTPVPTSYAFVEIMTPPPSLPVHPIPPRSPLPGSPRLPRHTPPLPARGPPSCYKEVVIQPPPSLQRDPVRRSSKLPPCFVEEAPEVPPPIPRRTK